MNESTTRAEHLQWSKDRAHEYINQGDYKNAVTSMMSDLNKHPETRDSPGIQLGLGLLVFGVTRRDAVNYIEGFL
jgi:hypothetical protein